MCWISTSPADVPGEWGIFNIFSLGTARVRFSAICMSCVLGRLQGLWRVAPEGVAPSDPPSQSAASGEPLFPFSRRPVGGGQCYAGCFVRKQRIGASSKTPASPHPRLVEHARSAGDAVSGAALPRPNHPGVACVWVGVVPLDRAFGGTVAMVWLGGARGHRSPASLPHTPWRGRRAIAPSWPVARAIAW